MDFLRGFEGRESVAAVSIVGCGEKVRSWPCRAGGGRFLKGLCLGLGWDVNVVRLEKNIFCSHGLFSENVGHCDLPKQTGPSGDTCEFCLVVWLGGGGEEGRALNRFLSESK